MPTVAKRSARKRQIRKTRKRSLLQFRILESEYKEIAKAAAERGLTISEEAARRLHQFRPPVAFEVEVAAAQILLSASELEELIARAVTRGVEQALIRQAEK